jgi:hypothetical protein
VPAQPPFRVGSINTPLSLADELQFRQWVASNKVPFDAAAAGPSDYDMRGYWRGLQNGNPMARPTEINANDGRPHFTDYYKTPLHQSFSADSQFAGPEAPQWINGSQLAAPSGRILLDEKQPAGLGALFR